MKTKKSFLQKMILLIFVVMLLFNFTEPMVYASLLEDEYKDYTIVDGVMFINNEGTVGKNGTQAYFVYDGSDGQKHKWPLQVAQTTTPYLYALEMSAPSPEAATPDPDWDEAIVAWQALPGIENNKIYRSFEGADLDDPAIRQEVEQEVENPDEIKPVDDLAEAATEHNVGFDDTINTLGGIFLGPVIDFLTSLGDLVINVLQWTMGTNSNIDTSDTSKNFGIASYLVSSEGEEDSGLEPESAVGKNATISIDAENEFEKGWMNSRNAYYIPRANYSPEEIFSGDVPGLDINFIDTTNAKGGDKNLAVKLQGSIAGWYRSLRNLSIVGLLSVLVYVGIRILLSATAADKAKYKQMLTDWLIALCILFFLHYIMTFTITITQSISDAINPNGASVQVEGSKTFKTNLLGLARYQTQYKDIGKRLTYLVMYLALVIYTVIFTIYYLKRAIMMAFLTMIAPLVALTYPIDKISDGKAQAFDSWLKEYVYNALIQPFHLIIYTVLVGTAMDLAMSNPFYMIAALGFILPAERILRSFFGFDKARNTMGTLKTLGIASMVGKLVGGKEKDKKGEAKIASGDKPLRFQTNAANTLSAGQNSNGTQQQNPNGAQQQNANSGLDETGQAWQDYIDSNPAVGSLGNSSRTGQSTAVNPNASRPTPRGNFGSVAGRYLGGLGRRAGRRIKGFAKWAGRTAFTGSAMALAGAISAASGGDEAAIIGTMDVTRGLANKGWNKAGSFIGGTYNEIVELGNAVEEYGAGRQMEQANSNRRIDTNNMTEEQQAQRIRKVADDLQISEAQVSKTLSVAKQYNITPEMLSNEDERRIAEERLKEAFSSSTRSAEMTEMLKDKALNTLYTYHDVRVEPRQSRAQKRRERRANRSAAAESRKPRNPINPNRAY